MHLYIGATWSLVFSFTHLMLCPEGESPRCQLDRRLVEPSVVWTMWRLENCLPQLGNQTLFVQMAELYYNTIPTELFGLCF
jgi:hypothetical protein